MHPATYCGDEAAGEGKCCNAVLDIAVGSGVMRMFDGH